MSGRSPITTHVLNTANGRPAAGIAITLEFHGPEGWQAIGSGKTDDDGRLATLLDPAKEFLAGTYRINFDVGSYFETQGQECFYPSAQIAFRVAEPKEHYHVPLLISGFGFSTYRGS